MKALFFPLLLVCSNLFAGEIIVLDVPAGKTHANDSHLVKFLVNQTDGSVSAALSISREHETCRHDREGGRDCTSWSTTLVSINSEIEGMKLADKLVTFEDRVDCGKMGTSRIFKVPTFFLSGNCTLDYDRVNVSGEKRILVKLMTKD